MERRSSLTLALPPDSAPRWSTARDDDHRAAAWTTASTQIIALAMLVLQHVNPCATVDRVLSYVGHSTLRELLDEATILAPDASAPIVRALLSRLDAGAAPGGVRKNPERRRQLHAKADTSARHAGRMR